MATHSRAPKSVGKRRTSAIRIPPELEALVANDYNLAAASLLYEMAALQPNERSQLGYKRAARAIAGLHISVVDAVAAGTLREVPFVGPASARIITELVEQRHSPTLEAALGQSAKAPQVAAKRDFRHGFLSHHVMQTILETPLAKGVVARDGYRGDFQMHSAWSDGAERIETMIEAAMDLGHTCLGITDHSYGLSIARGMSMADAGKQHAEIDALNAKYEGRFRVFKGIEANILIDGELDLQTEERQLFEFIVASPHSLLRRAEDQTARMIGAVRGRGVTILGHPRGRMFNSRAGVSADWDKVFEAAAARRVAIELDGNWHRQDIDFILAQRALEAGCIFALDSDAHSIGELRFSEYAVAHARLAGISADRVINYWSNEELEEWMERSRE